MYAIFTLYLIDTIRIICNIFYYIYYTMDSVYIYIYISASVSMLYVFAYVSAAILSVCVDVCVYSKTLKNISSYSRVQHTQTNSAADALIALGCICSSQDCLSSCCSCERSSTVEGSTAVCLLLLLLHARRRAAGLSCLAGGAVAPTVEPRP